MGWTIYHRVRRSAVRSAPILCFVSTAILPPAAYAQSIPDGGSQPLARSSETAALDPALTPPIRRGWDIFVSGRVNAAYTDNVYLTTTNRDSDYIISPAATFEAHETGHRSAIDASIEVAHDFYTQATDLNGPRFKALTDGTVRFADDALSMRARVATNLQASNSSGVISGIERNIASNQVQVLAYGAGPTFRQPLNDSVLAEAAYDVSGVSFLKAPTGSTNVAASDSLMQNANVRLSNEIREPLIEWNLTGAYEDRNLSGNAPSAQRARGEASGEYRMTNTVAVLSRAGYEWIDEPTFNSKLTGMYGAAGFLVRPNSRASLRFEGGYRYRKPHFTGELRFGQTERLTVTATYDQGVDTSQGFLNDVFARIRRDDLGNLIDPVTDTVPDPRTSPFDLNNQAFRYSRAQLRLSGTLERGFYNLLGTYERRSVDGVNGESWGTQAAVGRDLTQLLSLALEGRYVKTTSPTLDVSPGLNSETGLGTARLSYRLSETASASLRYSYLKQSTRLVDYRENAVVLSLAKRF